MKNAIAENWILGIKPSELRTLESTRNKVLFPLIPTTKLRNIPECKNILDDISETFVNESVIYEKYMRPHINS